MSRIAPAIVVTVGLAVLCGWQFDLDILKRLAPGLVAMNPVTAIALMLAAASCWILARRDAAPSWLRVSRAAAFVVLLIALLRLAGYALELDLGVDRVLFASRLQDHGQGGPNRMAPNSAAALMLISAAIILLTFPRNRWSVFAPILALGSALLCILAIVGYANGVSSLSAVGSFIAMAVHTALAIVALSLGILGIAYDRAQWNAAVGQSETGRLDGRQNRSVERKVAAGFTAALLVMSMIGITSYTSLKQFISDNESDNRTRQVLAALAELGSAIKDAETGGRGYVITGQDEYLEPYDAAIALVGPTLEQVRALTADNPKQQQSLLLLEPMISERLAIIKWLVGLRRDQGFEAARLQVISGEGRKTMNEIRQALSDMEHLERSVLSTRSAAEHSGAEVTIWIISVGSILGVLFIGGAAWLIRRDAAERRAAEQALRDSEERYRFLADATPQIVWTARADGSLDYYNARWYDFTGLTFEQTKDWGWKPVIHADDLQSCIDRWTQSLRSGEPFVGEYRFKRGSDGGYRWHLCQGLARRDEQGRIVQWIGTCTDIDNQRRAASELQVAKEVAEAANTAKSAFLATMSHEIRTPLNGVIGMSDLLIGTDLTPQQRRYAALVKSSAESLTCVINDILDFSKIEAGKLEIECVAFDLHVAVEDVMEMLAQKASTKGLELACHVHPEVPQLVRGDADRLRQILVNLVNNAIKFTETGAIIINLTVDEMNAESAMVRFAVSDTGIGIPKDRMDRLFKSFSQVDASTTRRFGGTGLGLAISKQLAELMDGRIGVESEEGRGSTFWFSARLQRQLQSSPRSMAVDPRGLRILAVDDNPTIRQTLHQQIASWGLEAATASSGKEALDVLIKAVAGGSPFQVAIVDADMPGMNGLELGQAVKARKDIGQTVLMILASLESHIDSERLKAMGFSGHMTKPVRQSQLFDAIMTAIANAAVVAPVIKPGRAQPKASSAPAVRRGVRILLAEDNEVNQIVAREILAANGYDCDVVENGQKAVQAVVGGNYDLVLMDCQMPEMDGFEAARAIRAREEAANSDTRQQLHLPILALTANAIKGDREQCLKAGMDAYISKPVDPKELISTIESLVVKRESPPIEPEPAMKNHAGGQNLAAHANHSIVEEFPFDIESVLSQCMKNVATATLILEKFERQAVDDLQRLTQTVSSGDNDRTSQVAHSLKGAAGVLSAQALAAIAAELEAMGRAGNVKNAEAYLARLNSEVQRCLDYMPKARTILAAKAGVSSDHQGDV